MSVTGTKFSQLTRMLLLAAALLLSDSLASLPDASAKGTTKAKSKWIKLDFSDRNRPRRFPRVTLPKIKLKHILEVKAKNGKVSLKVKFKNREATTQDFVFCYMIELSGSSGNGQTGPRCNVIYKSSKQKIKCVNKGSFPAGQQGFHFGCKRVTLLPFQELKVDFGSGKNPAFIGRRANEFEVSYADYLKVPNGWTYGAASCDNCGKAANGYYVPAGASPALSGIWGVQLLPFDDPYIAYQALGAADWAAPPEHRHFDDGPGVPSNFPVSVSELPTNVPSPVPNSYTVPIPLWDIHTMSPYTNSNVDAQTSLVVEGPAHAAALFDVAPATSSTFVIEAGMENPQYGSLIISKGSGILMEGEHATAAVIVHEPDIGSVTGASIFEYFAPIIHDTKPPVVKTYEIIKNITAGTLDIAVTATDATTTPLGANFWYSLDYGTSWDVLGLERQSDEFDEDKCQLFIGSTTNSGSAPMIMYFFEIQDAVHNRVYYGVGQMPLQIAADVGDFIKESSITLGDIFPNPANDKARFTLSMQQAETLSLTLYDIIGTRVLLIADKQGYNTGEHSFEINLKSLANGVYILRMDAGSTSQSRRLTIAR